MILKIDNKSFKANRKELIKIRGLIGLSKDKMGQFFLKHNIKKIGNRTYLKIENGEQKYDIDKFSQIAKAFNNEFQTLGISFRTSANKLLIDESINKNSNKNNKKNINEEKEETSKNKNIFSEAILWKVQNAENVFNRLGSYYNLKKVMNLGSLSPGSNIPLNKFFESVTRYNDIHYKKDSKRDIADDFTNECEVLDIADNMNRSLSRLKSDFGINLYMGTLKRNCFTIKNNLRFSDWDNVEELEYKLVKGYDIILFYYFVQSEPENIKVKYKNNFSEEEIENILKKYPVSEKFKKATEWELMENKLFNKLSQLSNYSITPTSIIYDNDLVFEFKSRFDELPDFDEEAFEEDDEIPF